MRPQRTIAELAIGEGVQITLMGDARALELQHEQVCSICRANVEQMREALKRAEVARPTWGDDDESF